MRIVIFSLFFVEHAQRDKGAGKEIDLDGNGDDLFNYKSLYVMFIVAPAIARVRQSTVGSSPIVAIIAFLVQINQWTIHHFN